MTCTSRRTFLLTLAAGALAGCVDDTTPVTTRYRTAVDGVMRRYRVPGALAAVRCPGDDAWAVALGENDVATHVPMRLDNRFPIRSITKSYTVTVLLQLVRERALTLDDKIDRWVPGLPNGNLISLADLAGMQSGLADYSQARAFQVDFGGNPARTFTESELVAYAIPGSPRFLPGAEYQYSNTNTVLLGMVVAQVTGVPLSEALRSRILAPLALAGTAYPQALALPDPHATPYDVNIATGALDDQPLISPTSLAGAGAMTSALDDLSTWAQALGDGRLIGPELQKERVARSRAVTNGPEYDRYGLGIGIRKGWIGHTGSGVGFQAAAMFDPRTGATIAVSVNATPSGGGENLNLAQEIFEALADVIAAR
jgi:D-alanyl-D-alanine carboxypeptidase